MPEHDRDFGEIMEEVEADLIKEDLPLHSRPFAALERVRQAKPTFALRIGFTLFPSSNDTDPDLLEDLIEAWYEERYGPGLKIDVTQGKTVMKIRGQLFESWIPLAFGPFTFFCAVGAHDAPDLPPEQGGQINALEYVINLGDGLRALLTRAECDVMLEDYLRAYRAYYAITPFQSIALVRCALGEHLSAVAKLMAFRPNTGPSHWASLQAVEMLIKAFLQSRGQEYPKGQEGHNLSFLTAKAQASGMPALPRDLVNLVQCGAGVRYGETAVTVGSALAAHHAALELTSLIGTALSPDS